MVASHRPRARIPWAVAALAVTAGCGEDLQPDVRYQVVGLVPATGGGCPGAAPTAPPEVGANRVRFTFLDRVDRRLRCDVVLARSADAPILVVPRREAPVDLHVEYFDDAGRLLARGQRADVALTGGGVVTIHATRTDAWTCPPGAAGSARAFHSATLLPTGEVLLLGGLVGAPGAGDAPFDPAAGAHVTGTAELYDPVAGRFTPVTIAGLQPRAFHEVLMLGTDGDRVRLLIVGGIGVAGDPVAPGNVAVGPTGGGAPWTGVAADPAAGRGGALALAAELLEYDPAARTFTRAAVGAGPIPRRFGTATGSGARVGEGLAVAGGLDGAGTPITAAESVRAGDGASGGSVEGHARLGATITAVGPTEALVWGGDLTTPAIEVRAGDRLIALDQAPAIAPGPSATEANNRSFHAAATLDGQVAVIGGLAITEGVVLGAAFTPVVQLVDPALLTATTLDAPALIGTGYPAAVGLHDGDVLFGGGVQVGACPSTLACPSMQSVRLRRGVAGEAVRATLTGVPGLARHGHRLTRLGDGTVLVTGGFGAATDPAQIRALGDAELYDPYEAKDDPLAGVGLSRLPGDVARVDGVPVARCEVFGAAAPDAAP